MPDQHAIDELSIKEIERVLAIKRREARLGQLYGDKHNNSMVEKVALSSINTPFGSHALDDASGKVTNGNPDMSDFFIEGRDHFANTIRTKNQWLEILHRILLPVEIIAVMAVVILGVLLTISVERVEDQTAAAQSTADAWQRAALPTIAPTPQLRIEQIVLPGGHTPPDDQNRSQFNFAEIPDNLIPLVQDQIFAPPIQPPPVTNETALRLVVPKLNIDSTIVQGIDWESLKLGVGQVPNGISPADPVGNVVLAAHNDIYGELFRYLDQLEAGDQFQIQSQTQAFTYDIQGWQIVEPSDVYVMETRDGPTATLISCYPYRVNTQRIAVFANRINI
ncbi:MAG: sortase [Anaerolineae bacterium]|nr:sortase [Anaerolineae bacterium]